MPPFTAPLARGDEAIKPARPIATEYSVDFRKVTSLPRDVVPSQACPQTNLSLIVIDGDQALSVGSSGIASPLSRLSACRLAGPRSTPGDLPCAAHQ